MNPRPLGEAEASALVSELRAMAQLPPGADKTTMQRARAIGLALRTLDTGRHGVGERAERACTTLEILLSSRRWKSEVASVEALRKDIRSATDRLRVAVEAALHALRPPIR